MEQEPERDYLNEALRMLEDPPTTARLPELRHLQALEEAYESQKIRVMRELKTLIDTIGNMP
jgi:hypothetical protein